MGFIEITRKPVLNRKRREELVTANDVGLPEETLVALLTRAAEESTSLRDFLGHLEAAFDALLGVHRYVFTAALVPNVVGDMQIALSGASGFVLGGHYWHDHAASLPEVARSWAVGITVHFREHQPSS